jgi:hypothetical protein
MEMYWTGKRTAEPIPGDATSFESAFHCEFQLIKRCITSPNSNQADSKFKNENILVHI